MARKTTSPVPDSVRQAAVAAAEASDSNTVATAVRLDAMAATAAANFVEFGSERHERIISPAYGGLTREKAELIIREREAEPTLWPYERYEQAKSFLAVLDRKPGITATKPAWRREEVG